MNEGTACRGPLGDFTAAWCIDPYGTKAIMTMVFQMIVVVMDMMMKRSGGCGG